MENQLCKGFMNSYIKGEEILEVLYAILPNGDVLESEESKKGVSFLAGKVYKVSEIPAYKVVADFEFIGNYPIPKLGKN